MTDVSTMTDRELDLAIADICRPLGAVPAGIWIYPRREQDHPAYSTDLNALRDGPERVLREAGWVLAVEVWREELGCTASWYYGEDATDAESRANGDAPTEGNNTVDSVDAGLDHWSCDANAGDSSKEGGGADEPPLGGAS